ncbi:MAG TPA: class I SAM-dependent RNA methyltransferase [Anaerolineae bacterium]|nr:class I SAM-dependent RNA methyltransferase [Anaerolineae bacterium]
MVVQRNPRAAAPKIDHRYDLFAACAPGFESVATAELFSLGIANPKPVPGGVEFRGYLAHVYKLNLWSRTAERILLRVGSFHAITFKELRDNAKQIEWEKFLRPGDRLALRVTCHKSRLIHSDAVAERVQLGITDRLGKASKILAKEEPLTQMISVRILDDEATISLDTSGELLHFRGYRQAIAKAPLRETLAASMILASGWKSDQPLIDPFCGSGTIPIEAALIACNIAPGLHRSFAFERWPKFDRSAWNKLIAQANESILLQAPSIIRGSDRDAGAIEAGRLNAERAGVLAQIEFKQQAISDIQSIDHACIISNLPYGQRLAADKDLRNLYAQFGKILREKFSSGHVAILAGDVQLEKNTGLNFGDAVRINNGGINVRFVQVEI